MRGLEKVPRIAGCVPLFEARNAPCLPFGGVQPVRHRRPLAASAWLPVVVWAGVIFAFSSVPSLSTELGTWDTILRKLAHLAEYAVLGALLDRALRRSHLIVAVAVAGLYAVTDEVHQLFVEGATARRSTSASTARRTPRRPSLAQRAAGAIAMTALLIDLDGALGDTRPLWRDWLDDASRVLEIDPDLLPADRAEAALALDRSAAGNWRVLLERYAADRATIYLRPAADVERRPTPIGRRRGAAGRIHRRPGEVARIAVAQLGATRRVEVVEAGAGALDRLRQRLGADAELVDTRARLVERAP